MYGLSRVRQLFCLCDGWYFCSSLVRSFSLYAVRGFFRYVVIPPCSYLLVMCSFLSAVSWFLRDVVMYSVISICVQWLVLYVCIYVVRSFVRQLLLWGSLCMCMFIFMQFVHYFIHPFIHSSIHTFIHSLVLYCFRYYLCSFVRSFTIPLLLRYFFMG